MGKSIKKQPTQVDDDKSASIAKKKKSGLETVTVEVPLDKKVKYEDSKGDEEFKQSIGRLRKVQI